MCNPTHPAASREDAPFVVPLVVPMEHDVAMSVGYAMAMGTWSSVTCRAGSCWWNS
jgi:hypothetical protein